MNRKLFKGASLAALVAALPLAAPAQSTGAAAIDTALNGQLDFRAVSYSSCLNQTTCSVGPVTIRAERRTGLGLSWAPAQIYWDPVDGLGVTEGGQNDEIDFDERLVVSFSSPQTVEGVWLSDLFLGEHGRYNAAQTDSQAVENVETAAIQLVAGSRVSSTLTIDGVATLPVSPFNANVNGMFQEDGDLRRRVVIQGDLISVVIPQLGQDGQDALLTIPIGNIDPDKRGIFEGVETVEVDLATILPAFNGTPIYSAGSSNANRLAAMLTDPQGLEGIRQAAVNQRAAGNWPNGELGAIISNATGVTQINFFAPFSSSNDFSVAGVVLGN